MLNSMNFHFYFPIKWNFSEIVVSQFQNLIELNVKRIVQPFSSPYLEWCCASLLLRCGAAQRWRWGRSTLTDGDVGDDRPHPTQTGTMGMDIPSVFFFLEVVLFFSSLSVGWCSHSDGWCCVTLRLSGGAGPPTSLPLLCLSEQFLILF